MPVRLDPREDKMRRPPSAKSDTARTVTCREPRAYCVLGRHLPRIIFALSRHVTVEIGVISITLDELSFNQVLQPFFDELWVWLEKAQLT